MDIAVILKHLDELLNDCKLDEAGKFLSESLNEAFCVEDYMSAITLYNEQIGFFRDCGMFDKAIDSCENVIVLIYKCHLENTVEHATTLLNVANAYRAAGKHDKSFEAYRKVKEIYDNIENIDLSLYASYYNNLSLLYQETENWVKSCECQHKALDIVEKQGNIQRIAISKTNLAVTLIRLGKMQEAEIYLNEANEYFAGLTPSDFHYSAALSAMGDVMYYNKKYEDAIRYYEMARSETELHMGKNNFYDIITENIAQTKSHLSSCEEMNGAELCRRFYEAFGRDMIHKNFARYESKIVCGIVGEGSDCFGFDDKYSMDHDFGPGFCIWLDSNVYDEIGAELQKAYDLLPRTFMGVTRVKSYQSRRRTGVFKSDKFYKDLLDSDFIPVSNFQWIGIPIEKLAVTVNGVIFTNTENEFTDIRKHLLECYPPAVLLKQIAQETAVMSQSGQYNFSRCLLREDVFTAKVCFIEFAQAALKCCHLLEKRYYPYYKWLFKSTSDENIKELIMQSEKLPIYNWCDDIIEPICAIITNKIRKTYDINTGDDYMDTIAHELSDMADELMEKERLSYEIAKMEFEAFDKVQNEGSRASCQDDWDTFSIMRVSQYLTWEIPMLKQYIMDFRNAEISGRNLITEKYAHMMSSTAPEKYADMKNNLPILEEDTVRLCNAICEIQVEWMEEFAKSYPKLSSNARAVHTYEDTEYSTSYETYLRGELLTYSREMLEMYARFIVSLHKSERNLAFLTMENTVRLYGYKSLDEAEEKL